MKLNDQQLRRLAETVLNDLLSDSAIVLRSDRGAVIDLIIATVRKNADEERELERAAERLLEQTLRSGGGGEGIDRHRMLRMIKEKLAKERRFVL